MYLIIGVGSHADVIEEIFHSNDIFENIFFASYGNVSCTKPGYLGNIFEISKLDQYECIIGIGDNKLRYEVEKNLQQLTIRYTNAIHKNVYISKNVKIGIGNVLCSGASIGTSCVLGNHNIINTNSSIDHHCSIYDFVHVAPNCALCGNVNVQTGSFIGVGCNIVPKISTPPWSFYKAHTLIKEGRDKIAIYKPYLEGCDSSITDAIRSGWISSQGAYLKKASTLLQEMIGAKHVLLVSNGTVATHCLFIALKYKYPTISKIYVPNNVYVAAINCALMEYPMNSLELVAIDEKTFNMSTNIHTFEKGSAVLVVHNVGNIVHVPRLKQLRPDLIFVEDNCEGLFGKYGERYTGSTDNTLCSSVSFFANKTITCGEGGAVFTNDTDVYEYLSKKINQGNGDKRYLHDMHAYNYRMTNLQAALLYDQLQVSSIIRQRKSKIFERYRSELKSIVTLPEIDKDTTPSEWMMCIRIPKSFYPVFETYMNEKGIETRPFFYPLHCHAHLSSFPVDETAVKLNEESCMIPSHPHLSENEQTYIIDMIKRYKMI
jgi:perosamine synthetase